MKVTKEQIGAYLQAVKAIADAIREAGRMGIGEGILYSALMGVMSLDAFERTVGHLTSAGLVRREAGRKLVWCGPAE